MGKERRMRKTWGLLAAAMGVAYLLGGASVATAGDHLKCYKVKDKTPDNRLQVAPANKGQPVVTDSNTGLLSENDCFVDNRKAKFCCDAVEKDGGPPTGDTIHNRFCCYKLKCLTNPNAGTHPVDDQFRAGGPGPEFKKPAYLCAPG
jgi:hypothetical protein